MFLEKRFIMNDIFLISPTLKENPVLNIENVDIQWGEEKTCSFWFNRLSILHQKHGYTLSYQLFIDLNLQMQM